MLRLVQLQGFESRRPADERRPAAARGARPRLATRPRLVLLDEPLSALDAKLREEPAPPAEADLDAVGSTTIVVTHDQDEAMTWPIGSHHETAVASSSRHADEI